MRALREEFVLHGATSHGFTLHQLVSGHVKKERSKKRGREKIHVESCPPPPTRGDHMEQNVQRRINGQLRLSDGPVLISQCKPDVWRCSGSKEQPQ